MLNSKLALAFANVSTFHFFSPKKITNVYYTSSKSFFFGKKFDIKISSDHLFIKKQQNKRYHHQGNWQAVFGPGGGFFGVGTSELIVIGAVAWLVLGPKRLYQLARDIGKISGEVKNVAEEARQTFQQAIEVENADLAKKKTNEEPQLSVNETTEKKNSPKKKSLMQDLDDLVKTEISTLEKKNK